MPVLYDNGAVTSIAASDIYYFDFPDSSYQFTNIVSLNVKDDSAGVNTKTYLTGYSEQTCSGVLAVAGRAAALDDRARAGRHAQATLSH